MTLNSDDFPAAHSMDSGWFALDKHGHLAHFETGEAGAMPTETLATGEASQNDAWLEDIIPWIARFDPGFTDRLEEMDPTMGLNVLFETAEDAKRADPDGVHARNPCMLSFGQTSQEQRTRLSKSTGFVGFAPFADFFFEDPGMKTYVPIAFYTHGSWHVPGDYQLDTPLVELDDDRPLPKAFDLGKKKLPTMDVDFRKETNIQLADHFGEEECVSWSEAGLRGEPAPAKAGSDGKAPSKLPAILIILVFFIMLWYALSGHAP